MRKAAVLLYGTICYAVFFAVFLYTIGFMGNFLVPKSIDSPTEGPLGIAILINGGLLLLFGLQHSVMARPGFKQWLTRFIPEPIERSTYVMATNVAMILLFWLWRPLGGNLWDVDNTAGQAALYTLFGLGWLTILATTFLINHFDLFGLRQVWLYFRGKEYTSLSFVTPGPYKIIRHPLYVGWLMAFWATPTMSVAHLVFALGMTAYILIAIVFEERDLIDYHGERYAAYRRNTPMLLPRLFKSKTAAEESAST